LTRRAAIGARAARDGGRLAALCPSFRDFVDDALHHPAYGYYGAGRVRFGDGGHFDTYPLALSPLFGRMLAESAHRLWRRLGRPREFEICEVGAGNGQLCADAVMWIAERGRRDGDGRRFAAACRYRIFERSAALVDRQRQLLGSLSERVVWTRADLSRRRWRRPPLASAGLVFANEVLDALAHHKIVGRGGGEAAVVFVVPRRRSGGGKRIVSPAQVACWLARPDGRRRLHFEEAALPLSAVPGLEPFLRRSCPELFRSERSTAPYFACPEIERLVANTARLYARGEIWWIDYGAERRFHRRTPERRRVFAGPPRSGRSVYDRPGADDVTFMVDFSALAAAAQRAGLEVAFFGPQGELARRSGVRLDRRAVDLIVRTRALGWALAVVGVGPERRWRRGALGWRPGGRGVESVRSYVERSVAEFTGRRKTDFKLMILRKRPAPTAAGVIPGHARRTTPADPAPRSGR
jgi:SAM-dependent MidA family methyltransferase